MRWWTFGLLALLAVANWIAPSANATDWVSYGVRDHLTGKTSPGAAVGVVLEEGARKRTGRLWAYCESNSTTVNLQAEYTHFGSSSVTVRYTLDGGAPIVASWDTCKGGGCAGLWNGQGIPFLKSLFDKRELRLVIDRRYSDSLFVTGNIDGARGALAEVGEPCGWTPKDQPKSK